MSAQPIPCPLSDGTHAAASFTLLSRVLHSEELGTYRSYGLQICFSDGTQLCLEDLSTDHRAVQRFAALCNRLQPEPIHLEDILEDFLSDPDGFFA